MIFDTTVVLLGPKGPYFDYETGHFGPKQNFEANRTQGPHGEKPNVSGLFYYM